MPGEPKTIPTLDEARETWATSLYEDWFPGMHRDDALEAKRAEGFDTFLEGYVAARVLTMSVEEARAAALQRPRAARTGAEDRLFTCVLDVWCASMDVDHGRGDSEMTLALKALFDSL